MKRIRKTVNQRHSWRDRTVGESKLMIAGFLALFIGIPTVLGSCGSDDDVQGPPGISDATKTGEYYPTVKSYCDPNRRGVLVYVTEIYGTSSGLAGGSISAVLHPVCGSSNG